MKNGPKLKRAINLPFMVLYGIGTMVGAGFFALCGKVVGEAGVHTPMAFLCSGLLAFISATSFAELASRFPFSAGEVRYAHEAFSNDTLSSVIGCLVIFTGMISSATLVLATTGFIDDFIHINRYITIIGLVLLMGGIAGWGVGKSVGFVTGITVIGIGALLYVVVTAGSSLAQLPERYHDIVLPNSSASWLGVFSGAFLSFYAYVGFEDMVNMAEEVKKVQRNLPIAILVSIVITTLIYFIVSLVAVLSVSPERLMRSNTPIAEIVKNQGWVATKGLVVASLLMGLNGALVQIVMASRVTYGMVSLNQLPTWFGIIHPKTQTPIRATGIITFIILVLALFFPLIFLAKLTSFIILLIFSIVNLSLWRIKCKEMNINKDIFSVPRWLSLFGFISCVTVLLFQTGQLFIY